MLLFYSLEWTHFYYWILISQTAILLFWECKQQKHSNCTTWTSCPLKSQLEHRKLKTTISKYIISTYISHGEPVALLWCWTSSIPNHLTCWMKLIGSWSLTSSGYIYWLSSSAVNKLVHLGRWSKNSRCMWILNSTDPAPILPYWQSLFSVRCPRVLFEFGAPCFWAVTAASEGGMRVYSQSFISA